ncbi:MBL fold metallo-hydrolase [Burkholderia sp. AU30198]|uniref:Metallo-beta-lactamase superfamily protein n=1 Tax=Burkholderia aenigmatica TaxID=2015348 RepID=A0A6J5JNB4_9BURK|nr:MULTISPECIES: MBL fold metallo-hydrolase [Burkholderia]MCA8299089.1 MBL fold metallo-hydrolase [Burkholderia sp. AU30198]CAB3972665.1 metallo-beta-lactamase superfamily protein [Burkholderia aenigmatica]
MAQEKPVETRPKDALDYPFDAPPAAAQTVEVVPGVHWFRMPLPYALDHINLWALDDGDGWAIVDTGACTDDAIVAWRALFARSDGRPMTRVFVTHLHPDHIGLAGWLTRKFGIRLWMTRLEYLSCRMLVSDTGREAPADAIAFLRRAGWSDVSVETYRARFGSFGKHVHALPDSYRRLRDGDMLTIGAHEWRVIVGSGHSPEHACLYCSALRILISGDQVLPRISSNVSVTPTEPDANPMAEWLESLENIRREVPDDVLVLPAHGECFRGLHARIDALADSQQRAFARLLALLGEPQRVIDTFPALFSRPIDETRSSLLHMATGEAVACLNYLIAQRKATYVTDEHGVAWYRATHA